MSDKQSEFIEQLFNAISSDPVMTSDLKISLLKLQLPIHKLSLSDSHFISNSKHPARRTLFIARRLCALSKNNLAIIKKIQLILSELGSTPSANKFSTINQQLDKLTNSIQSINASNKTPKNIPNTSLKQTLQQKIKHCINGHDIPETCQNLVLKLWPQTLFVVLEKHGENSPQWVNSINLYVELLDAIQPIKNNAHMSELKSGFMNIVRHNNNVLLTYLREDKVEEAIKSLITHFNKKINQSIFSNSLNTGSTAKPTKKSVSLPANLKPGVWCEIFIDGSTPARRLRLSLINMQTGILIFVNRNGIKKLEKDPAEFCAELKSGLSKIYKHEDLFSNSFVKARLKKIG